MIPILSYPCTSSLTHLNTSEEGILMTNQKPDVFGPENFNNNPILNFYITLFPVYLCISLINYPYLNFFCCKTPHRCVAGNTRKIPNLLIRNGRKYRNKIFWEHISKFLLPAIYILTKYSNFTILPCSVTI